ncbi:hypothetical protein [Coleofasciculus sp. E1-EBD-02]|jgi:hypothetical protein|uniref:hypothetical protein n=1 Tax=Coleofasciculus sp. E1-EBD-02 TaxID=3068481 RepID=UPI0032F4A22E
MLILADTSQAASQILQEGQNAQSAIAAAMDGLWDEVLGGGLYLALVQLSLLFAVGTLVLFMVQWSQAVLNDDERKPMTDLIFPVIVVVLLANNGAVLADTTKAFRGIINQTNETLLSSVSASVSLQEAYQSVVGEIGAQSAIESLASNCQTIAEPTAQQNCLTDAAAQAQSLADQMQAPPSNWFSRFMDGVKDPVGAGVSAIASTIQLAIRGWIIAFGIAFQWTVEISLLLTGLIGPVAVGLSLLPVQAKAIYSWLIGFFSVGMVKIYFNVIVGLVATMVVNAGENDPMIFAFATGLLSPILAMILAAGGGMAVFNSIPKITQTIANRIPDANFMPDEIKIKI